jgi:hypothetical protein
VEAPPSPKREPPAAAATLGASPAKSLKSKQQQRQQQQDTAPVYDFYGAESYNDNVYTPAAYGDAGPSYDRGRDYSSSYHEPPPRADPYKQPAYSKPPKEHQVNYKRMFYALLLMLTLAGVAVGIWAGVTYGRKNGVPAAAAPAFKPTNFTMSLAAGSKNSNGQVENCTDWFSNSTVSTGLHGQQLF